jgi:hypothetical protein
VPSTHEKNKIHWMPWHENNCFFLERLQPSIDPFCHFPCYLLACLTYQGNITTIVNITKRKIVICKLQMRFFSCKIWLQMTIFLLVHVVFLSPKNDFRTLDLLANLHLQYDQSHILKREKCKRKWTLWIKGI